MGSDKKMCTVTGNENVSLAKSIICVSEIALDKYQKRLVCLMPLFNYNGVIDFDFSLKMATPICLIIDTKTNKFITNYVSYMTTLQSLILNDYSNVKTNTCVELIDLTSDTNLLPKVVNVAPQIDPNITIQYHLGDGLPDPSFNPRELVLTGYRESWLNGDTVINEAQNFFLGLNANASYPRPVSSSLNLVNLPFPYDNDLMTLRVNAESYLKGNKAVGSVFLDPTGITLESNIIKKIKRRFYQLGLNNISNNSSSYGFYGFDYLPIGSAMKKIKMNDFKHFDLAINHALNNEKIRTTFIVNGKVESIFNSHAWDFSLFKLTQKYAIGSNYDLPPCLFTDLINLNNVILDKKSAISDFVFKNIFRNGF